MHAWTRDTPLEETLAALDHAVASGRARYAGVSNFSGWQTARGRDLAAGRSRPGADGRRPRSEYSLLQRGIEREVLPAARGARRRAAALVAAGPRGADRQVPQRHAGRLPGAPRRTSRASSSPTSTTGAAGIVDAVATAADGLGVSPLEVALAWVRDRPGVAAPIVGARTAAQLRGALGPRG